MIERSSEGQQLPTEWTYGLIRQESRFIPQASSSVGARGLMQLMPKTATWMAKQLGLNRYEAHRISDIEMNLILGTAYLRTLYESLDESFPLATAAYNAGPRARGSGARPCAVPSRRRPSSSPFPTLRRATT